MLVDVSVGELKSLLAKKMGDPKRLQLLINSRKEGKKFSESDMMFVEHLLSLKFPPKTFPKTSSENITQEAIQDLVITTTPNIEGSKIEEYLEIVSGEAVMGANIVRDWFASVTDIIGGRSGQYEGKFREAKDIALDEMVEQAITYGANAVVGVTIDYEMVRESMMMVAVHGTAVKIVKEKNEVKTSKKN